MPNEDIVLAYKDSSVEPWIVPVPDGSTPEDVAKAWAASGWSLVEGANPGEVAADLAARNQSVAAEAPVEAPVASPDVPAEPVTTDAPSGDVTTPEGN